MKRQGKHICFPCVKILMMFLEGIQLLVFLKYSD